MHGTLVMPKAPWPTHGGREVYSHHLLGALDQLGQPMRAILTEASADTNTTWPLASRVGVDSLHVQRCSWYCKPTGALDRHWRSYWGWSGRRLGAMRELLEHDRPDFVAAAGLQMLPALAAVPDGIQRIWLALDEPAGFQLSIGRSAKLLVEKLKRMKLAATFAAYQRTYARRIDLAVAVSDADAKALHRLGGFERVISLPNGVDADHFAPETAQPQPYTAVFWGRLDFAPNIQALRWFTRHVWPTVVSRQPKARLRVIGRNPDQALQEELADLAGVQWIGPVDDIRPWASGSSVVVLPIQSGAGIKNKLLEAAAMARPIIASPMAVAGLTAQHAWQLADEPHQWVGYLESLWANHHRCRTMGEQARQWVLRDHSWVNNAQRLIDQVEHRRIEVSTAAAASSGRRAA